MPSGGLEDYAPQRTQILRERAGVGVDVIAVKCEVTVGTVRGWLAGRLTPSETNGTKLAAALGVRVPDLTNTPPDQPTLRQLRQWRGLRGEDAAKSAGIGITPVYTAETYVSPMPDHIRTALANAYDVSEDEVEAAWQRGRRARYGDALA
uniref:helix-turn-helix domain-containing protein n=1 Tax=Nocardia suismassiliense TaxID=2077092 RepID=UPI003F4944D0